MLGNIARTVGYYRDQWGRIARLGFLSVLSAQCQTIALVMVIPLAKAVASPDEPITRKVGPLSIPKDPTTLAIVAAIAIVVAAVLDIATSWARSHMMSSWEYARREQVIGEYLRADYSTQAAERLGTLGTLTGYVGRSSATLGAIVNGLGSALTIGVFVAGAIVLDYRAALLLIGTVVALSLLMRPLMQRTKRYSKALSQMLVDYGRNVTEATRMARDVRVFDASGPIGDQLTRTSRRVSKLRQRSNFISGVTSPSYQYAGMLFVVGALGFVARTQPSDVTTFGTIALLLLRSMANGSGLQSSYQSYLDCAPYIEKVEEMRATYHAHATDDGTITLETIDSLALDGVSFSYDGDVEALGDVSASFRVGEIVGIVGASGSGKSTLSQLILRLRTPTAGRILVDGVPAGDYTLSSWYRHVSLVPQDPRLLHGTVAENIAFLDRSITRDQVVAAAKAAGIHDVIESLESGYDTLVGPAFRDLSGGQIQRIGIARALARGAEVLVLDEPTSALDVHSEVVIQNTLESLGGQVLVLIIAHRLSTLSICDRILVLRNGRVETIGTLEEVSERSDFFRRALDAGTLEVGIEEASLLAPAAAPDDA
jgi:ATP-binding cassette subfamily B protein